MTESLLVLSPRQSSELITALLGRGEIPIKFTYMTAAGARAWENLAAMRGSEEVRGINRVESNLLTSKLDSFLQSCGSCDLLNIIDIGCGEGSPVLPLLHGLHERNVSFRYVPVDISPLMLRAASERIQSTFPSAEVTPEILDFELGNFADLTYQLREPGTRNLMLFLGSTLGNQADRHRVLTNMRDSMTSHDYLIVGVELVNLSKVEKLLSHYRGDAAERFVFAAASALGLTVKDGELIARFNNEAHQVELIFRLTKDATLTVGSERLRIEQDEHLLLARSHKFSEWVFVKVLQEAGFRIELLTTSAEKGYSLVMCQPSRFAY